MKRSLIVPLILGAAVAAPLAASAQQYDGPDRGYRNDDGYANVQRSGYIASVNGSSFTLGDGTTVFLRRGTVINPTGLSLRDGMIVQIAGIRDGRGRINASEVDWNRRWNRSGDAYRGERDDYNNRDDNNR